MKENSITATTKKPTLDQDWQNQTRAERALIRAARSICMGGFWLSLGVLLTGFFLLLDTGNPAASIVVLYGVMGTVMFLVTRRHDLH